MAASFNKVLLMGNLTRDPEVRYIPSGSAVATFSIAVNRVYKDQAGAKKEEVTFVRIVVWGRRAEVCGQYLSKGSPVFVEGRLKSRSWQTPEGQTRTAMEVVADSVQFLRGAAGGAKTQSAPEAVDAGMPAEDIEAVDMGGKAPKADSGDSFGGNDEIPF